MYTLFRDLALAVMKAPSKPPDPPAGAHDEVKVYRASPSFLTYRLLGFWLIFSANWLLLWAGFFAGIIAGEEGLRIFALVLMPVLAVIQFCTYFSVRIDYDMRYYIVTDRSLRVREGAFIVKEKTISYANVQNIRVVQGPLLRLFGIWHLKVDTAGGGGMHGKGESAANIHRVQMAGIDSAHEVRDLILGHLKRRGISAGLGDLDDRDDDASLPTAAGAELVTVLRELRSSISALRATADRS